MFVLVGRWRWRWRWACLGLLLLLGLLGLLGLLLLLPLGLLGLAQGRDAWDATPRLRAELSDHRLLDL